MIRSISYNLTPYENYDATGSFINNLYEINLRLVSDSEEEVISAINGMIKELGEKLKVGKK